MKTVPNACQIGNFNNVSGPRRPATPCTGVTPRIRQMSRWEDAPEVEGPCVVDMVRSLEQKGEREFHITVQRGLRCSRHLRRCGRGRTSSLDGRSSPRLVAKSTPRSSSTPRESSVKRRKAWETLRRCETRSALLRSSVESANTASDAAQDLHAFLVSVQATQLEHAEFPDTLRRKVEQSQQMTLRVLELCLQSVAASERLREVDGRKALEQCLFGCSKLSVLRRAFTIFRRGVQRCVGDFRQTPRCFWDSLHALFRAPSLNVPFVPSEVSSLNHGENAAGHVDDQDGVSLGTCSETSLGACDWRRAPDYFWTDLYKRFPTAASKRRGHQQGYRQCLPGTWQQNSLLLDIEVLAGWLEGRPVHRRAAAPPNSRNWCFCAGQRPGKAPEVELFAPQSFANNPRR
mmetsp:Transcript_2208/g.6284  ORF Transcript_2208/g.6284 Transcript_2208/m.6284 type:complete len:403 (-) Transcript_2208:281-1489(-)